MNNDKSSPNIDDFWEDCQDAKNASFKNLNNSPENLKLKNIGGTINYQLRTSKYNMSKDNNTTKNSTNSNSRSVNFQKPKKNQCNFNSPCSETTYKNLSNKYPEIYEIIEQEKNNNNKKLKSKKALLRCYGLYSYGVEIKKNIEYNKEQNDIKKQNDELSLCTFKPKINKKLNYVEHQRNIFLKNNYRRSKKKLANNSLDKIRDIRKEEEDLKLTFKPIIKYRLESNKVFNNTPKFIKDKENAEFILRYTKARDENLIKKCNLLYRKDDCFKNSLLTLATRICDEQYKNCLNVNHVLSMFGETVYDRNKKVNASICDFKGLTITEEDSSSHHKKRNKTSKSTIVELRKSLQKINLD